MEFILFLDVLVFIAHYTLNIHKHLKVACVPCSATISKIVSLTSKYDI